MGYTKPTADYYEKDDASAPKRIFTVYGEKPSYSRLKVFLKDRVFPAPLFTYRILFLALGTLYAARLQPVFSWLTNIRYYTTDRFFGDTVTSIIAATVVLAFVLWVMATQLLRLFVRLLLQYRQWMFDPIGHPSAITRIWKMFVNIMSKCGPSCFSYQELLPALPLPRLESTIEKYLKSIKPVVSETEYKKLTELACDYRDGDIGKGVQRKLLLKWLTSTNYLTDWWKEVVYLRHRGSLIRTQVAGASTVYYQATCIQAAKAAVMVLTGQRFHKQIQDHSLPPITLGGIPMCQQQYADIHRTIRLPGKESDVMRRLPPHPKHVAVYCRGCWYRLAIYAEDRIASAAELEVAFQTIIDRRPDPQPGETHLSALTAGSRARWADVRERFFSDGVNKKSLNLIETSCDILFIDDEDRFYDESNPECHEDLAREYARSLHGDGYAAWFDRPYNMFISKNARFTCQGEHSAADAMVYTHVIEYTKYHERFTFGYLPDGHCKGKVDVILPVERLEWDIPVECQAEIDESYAEARQVVDDFDMVPLIFREYGKNLMKKAKVSPDAYCQMALQLAFHRDQGYFPLTYEAAMTRLFKRGRTETVRSCTDLSSKWVLSMSDDTISREEKVSLLRAACENHQELYRRAMTGEGCDRLLFAHRVATRYYGLDAPFLDAVFSQPWILSTSQVPQHQQSDLMDTLNAEPDMFWPAGMFACPEGSRYGTSYAISPDGTLISFTISTWKHLDNTCTRRFRQVLIGVLRDMREMLQL